jgi:uncharacterized membrane protein SirB2
MLAYYPLLKHLHLTCILLTLVLFIARALAVFSGASWPARSWARIVPHLIDSLLLASGLALAFSLQQYPFVHAWLSAKFFALTAYIVLGSLALKHAKTQSARLFAFGGALLAFGYLFLTALNRSPDPLRWTRFFL